jgi:nuclear GTP-binding protein
MAKKHLKTRSKRVSCADKYKVIKKVKQHHRKLKKLAKKSDKLGNSASTMSKSTRIPNLFPNKPQMLEEQEAQKHFEALLKAQKKNEISEEDIEKMVVEQEDYKIVKEKIEEDFSDLKNLPKSEFKRRLNQMVVMSDVCIEVIDARDPINFRSKELEKNVIKNKKKLIILLNKSDLVSSANLEKWKKLYRRNYPTLVFSSKELSKLTTEEFIKHPFYTELIDTLHQITSEEYRKIAVSVIGYPNVGKSSIIELFRNLNFKAFKSSVGGLYELAMENISKHHEKDINYKLRLLSNSGTIFTRSDNGICLIPKSTKDIEEIKEPLLLIKDLFKYIPKEDLMEFYEIPVFDEIVEFLENVCKKNNFMIKKGYPNIERAAKFVIKDITEGKIKFECELDEE